MSKAFETGDEVFKSEWHYQPHEDKMYRKLTQPTEDLILNRNAELRKNPDALRDLSFGRLAASIPMNIYEQALRDGYQLNCTDSKVRRRELRRFLATPIGKACMVNDKGSV